MHHYEACECDRLLHDEVKKFFALDNYGSGKVSIESSEEKRAMDILTSTVRRIEDRYECGLLWKHDHVTMPNSYPMALMRLQCLERKIAMEPDLLPNLNDQIDNLVNKHFARKLNHVDLR